MHQAVGANSESLCLSFLRAVYYEWNATHTDECIKEYSYLCFTELLQPADVMVALSKGYHLSGWLWVCCYKLLHWIPDTSERKSAVGLALCFPLCVAPWTSAKLFWRHETQTSEAKRPIPEKYNSIYVEQHSFQQVFELKYLKYFSTFN